MVAFVKKILDSRIQGRILVSAAILAWLGILLLLFSRNIFNIHFGDEDDNFLLGKLLLNGKILYSQLFSHHQPLGYILSAFVQKATSPETIYQLVTAHRMFIFAWAAVWTVIASFYFGKQVLFFTLIYEVSKRAIFGDQFLSESLAVYPIIFVTLFLLRTKKSGGRIAALLVGVAFSTAAALLLPAWPLLAFIFVFVVIRERLALKRLAVYFVVGASIPILITLNFIDIGSYLHHSFYINNVYYLKYGVNSDEGIRLVAFITPLIAIFKGASGNSFLQLIQILSCLWLFILGWLVYKKNFYKAILIVAILGLANIRYVEPGKMFFQGFHSVPWFALLILTTGWGIFQIRMQSWRLKQFVLVLAVIIVGTSTWLMGGLSFERGNKIHAYEVSHARTIGISSILDKISSPGDTLFVVPGDWLLYWSTGVKPASSMLNYYGWMKNVPEIKTRVDTLMTHNSPTFFYCIDDCLAIGMDQYLDKYHEIRERGVGTQLFVLRTKISGDFATRLSQNELEVTE